MSQDPQQQSPGVRVKKKVHGGPVCDKIPPDAEARRAKFKRELAHLTTQLGRLMQRADELSKEADAL